MMKKLFALMLALAVLLTFAGCGGKKNKCTIAVVAQQSDNLIFLAAQEGAMKAGEDLGITVQWEAPARADADLQNEIINSLIEQKVDGIAISCVTGDGLKNAIDRATAEGIPVSCFDVDAADSQRVFYAGTENYKVGYACGEYMVKLFKDSGLEKVRVAQLEGIPGADDIEARKQGFADAIAGTNIEVVYTFPCKDSVDMAIEGVEAYTRAAGGNVDAWFMTGGWPFWVNPAAMPELSAWKLSDPAHKVITVDVIAETTPAFFEAGILDVAIGQDFYQMGYASVTNLYKLISGEDPGLTDDPDFGCPFINTGVQIVTADNYKEAMGIR